MNLSAYKSPPLSDEMEKRIRERIRAIDHPVLPAEKTLHDAHKAALEWVLAEAASLVEEVPEPLNTAAQPLRSTGRVRDHSCPECQHEHEGRTECSKYLGEGKFCRCEAKVTA